MSFLKNKNLIIFFFLSILILLSGFKFISESEVLGLKHPESAFLYKGYLYISNIGSSPVSQNLDGFITKLDKYGNILEYKFIDGLKAPKGIFPYKDELYIADLDRVCVVNLMNRKKECVSVKGSEFLNDIYVLNGNAYVTDTATNCIYKIDRNLGVNKFYCTKDSVFSPNGIWFSKKLNAFIVVSFNRPVVNEIDLNGNLIKSFYLKGLTGFDGLIVRKDRVYISDYKTGKIIETDLTFKKYTIIKEFNTPVADFYLNKSALYAPLLEANKLFVGKAQ